MIQHWAHCHGSDIPMSFSEPVGFRWRSCLYDPSSDGILWEQRLFNFVKFHDATFVEDTVWNDASGICRDVSHAKVWIHFEPGYWVSWKIASFSLFVVFQTVGATHWVERTMDLFLMPTGRHMHDPGLKCCLVMVAVLPDAVHCIHEIWCCSHVCSTIIQGFRPIARSLIISRAAS